MKIKQWLIIIIACVLCLLLVIKNNFRFNKNSFTTDSPKNTSGEAFNRNNDNLILTKHARCRMDCRHITLDEIKEILHTGNINYNKSEPNDSRGPKYAVEGYSNEHQHLRIIFAPEEKSTVVVTCIDLDEEWSCNCN